MALLGGGFLLGGEAPSVPAPIVVPTAPLVISAQAAFNAADPLGVDISCYPDLDAGFSLVSGRTALGQALARRLETPRGGLFYDSDYGEDVREMVNDVATTASAQRRQQQIEAEALKEERVLSADATVTYSPQTSSANVKLVVDTAIGSFTFILAVTQVSVTLLG